MADRSRRTALDRLPQNPYPPGAMLAKLVHAATLLAALTLTLPAAHAAEVATASSQGMLILRNGEVLEGHVTRSDDVYMVDFPDGQIRVRVKDVEVVCRDLQDGYQRKRAAIQVGNVHHHLELAQWCLHHDLLGPAAAELADAKTADPKSPMIAVLQRRLKMALEPPTPAVTKAAASSGPSNDELDRMVRGLPQKAVETFTQSVQPVLLNHCTGSGCHSSQSTSDLRLSRIPAGRPSSRRLTQRNLYAVLKYVNRDDPADSRLLVAASRAHGTVQHAIFDEHQASQYRRLVEWVVQIADPEMADGPASLPPCLGGADNVDDGPGRLSPHEAKRAHPLPSQGARQSERGAERQPNEKKPEKPSPKTAAPPAGPSDPFDPEVFNRQYGAQPKPATEAKPKR